MELNIPLVDELNPGMFLVAPLPWNKIIIKVVRKSYCLEIDFILKF